MCKTMGIAVLTVAFGTVALLRADEPAAKPAPNQANQAEMMASMMKAAAPGPEHQKLKTMEGKFSAEVTAADPMSGKEEKSTGTMTNTMILGGRYLKQDYNGPMMGMPFHGGGLVGYDNMKKKYTMLWVDEMSTQMMVSEGTLDESAKTITTLCTFDCPLDNSKKTMKQVITMNDEDHHTFEMYDVGADGKQTKSMTIKYTRVKE